MKSYTIREVAAMKNVTYNTVLVASRGNKFLTRVSVSNNNADRFAIADDGKLRSYIPGRAGSTSTNAGDKNEYFNARVDYRQDVIGLFCLDTKYWR